ncbi:hypothetical protein FPZ24_07745 [Sphingomonas panacisoli]|uniref:Uncharacterized protein n=2 Tax=Sphingomonas panacisoli TaxID=1813879 RepID=A0A5B8LLI9_9SPHN|nr:hypothetical protein [Sphingomonas panacisoli]QDZ09101.1 hypothetical protein FPZ24_07745 [Sphingomonas panacisoli]
MSEPKPFASLSSGLLARKGQAKPAMRPQGFTGGYSSLAGGLEDLGWNDMGQMIEPEADVHPIHENEIVAPPEGVPPVLAQRRQLKEELEAPVIEAPIDDHQVAIDAPTPPVPAEVVSIVRRPVSVATANRLARETRHKAKAAFTLRLDEDRHLRLRLASALSGRSAQQLVTEALDAFLESVPEVDDLARQVPVRAKG